MVQLLLLLNLIIIFLVFLAVGMLFNSVKRLSDRLEELEAEILKISSKTAEFKVTVEKLESRFEFLQNQVKILLTGLRKKGEGE